MGRKLTDLEKKIIAEIVRQSKALPYNIWVEKDLYDDSRDLMLEVDGYLDIEALAKVLNEHSQ